MASNPEQGTDEIEQGADFAIDEAFARTQRDELLELLRRAEHVAGRAIHERQLFEEIDLHRNAVR